MTEVLLRAALIGIGICMGAWGYREFRSGVLRIENGKLPPRVILRSERPFAYWTFIVFFYATLLLIVAVAAFASRPN